MFVHKKIGFIIWYTGNKLILKITHLHAIQNLNFKEFWHPIRTSGAHDQSLQRL